MPHLPAISCLGAFPTPAPERIADLIIAGVRKPAHNRSSAHRAPKGGKVETNLDQSLAAGENDGNKCPKAANGSTSPGIITSRSAVYIRRLSNALLKAGVNPANLVLSTNGT